MKHKFKVGDPVLVVGNISRFRTCAGFFGYIEKYFPKEDTFHVLLLTRQEYTKDYSRRREEAGSFDTTTEMAKAADLRPLRGLERLARVRALRKHQAQKAPEPRDTKLDALIKKWSSAKYIEQERKDREALEAESRRIGNVFTLPGRIRRFDKSQFPAYRDPVVEEISRELMEYAARGPSKCTLTERARWVQCLAATEATSFWSPRKEVRALVKELDLDPMISEFEDALYRDKQYLYVPNGKLRAEAIRLWNRGAVLLQIQDMQDANTCWSSYKEGAPAGFSITYAFRRKLPVL